MMAKCQTHYGFLMAMVVLFCVSTTTSQPVSDEAPDVAQIQRWVQEKRPFCNAFAGCGRKRASFSQENEDVLALQEVLGDYPRLLNTENKLWDKLYTKLQQRYNRNHYDIEEN